MTTVLPSLRVLPVRELGPPARHQIIALCSAAFDEDFGPLFQVLPGSTHVLAERDGTLVGHACWVTRMDQSGRNLGSCAVSAAASWSSRATAFSRLRR